jgi:transposase-like protein
MTLNIFRVRSEQVHGIDCSALQPIATAAPTDSRRVDETYIRVKGKWVYLYRAVDSSGATIDFLLSAKRDAAAAERFLGKALG